MNFPRLSRVLVPLVLAGLMMHAALAAAPDASADVVLGGTLIQRIRTSYDGLTPQQRANEVQGRLNAALSQGPIRPGDITVAQRDGDWCVLFRGGRFLTVDPVGAKQNGLAPEAQAEQWAGHLRLVLPSLTEAKGK